MANDSEEFLQLTAEAADIARSTSQRPSTVHLLLALFTVPNPAEVLLRERGCDEDAVLAELVRLGRAPDEAPEIFASVVERARQLADDCANQVAEGLHLLVALTRLSRCSAAQLLETIAPPLSSLRTTALGYLTGSVPRRKLAREEVQVPARAAGADIQGRRGRLAMPLRESGPRPSPAPSASPRPVPSRRGAAPSEMEQTPVPFEPAAPHALAQPLSVPPPAVRSFPPEAPVLPAAGTRSMPPAPRSVAPAAPAAQPAPRFALDPRQYPWLCAYGKNLSQLAAQGELDPAIGRAAEVEEVLDILGKRRANNPVLVGEPGVGKTAIVEGLAQRLVDLDSSASEAGEDRIMVELDVAGLVAGTALRGSFSERLIGIKDEVRRADGRVVVFIDELHMLIGAGATSEGPQDAANELKAALARGEFPCVGATTHDEFRKHIQGDPALERRFVPVLVREPSQRATREILEGAMPRYEAHHGVRFLPAALEAAAQLSARYVRDRFLPDKAFAAIDLAGSRARREGRTEVGRDDVARAVARMAGLPEDRLLAPEGDRFLTLERRLAERVVGQELQIARIARALRRNYAGFSAQRPLASFLCLGPSGVGKTETARVLAEELFPAGPEEAGTASGALVRIDLSEYSEAHSVARLVGAPPGYVGYGEGGMLSEAVRRRPACVVLLDEAEKAHPAVLQLLLAVLDEGQLTDGRGRRVDFTSAVVVLTSNAGAAAFGPTAPRALGFGKGETHASSGQPDPGAPTLPPQPVEHPQAQRALELARGSFPPELWSRFDERLVFAPLSRDEVGRIAQLLLADSSRRLWQERRIAFRVGPGLVEHLIDAGGYEASLGARPMRQTIERLVESPLADQILSGRVRPGERLLAIAAGPGVEFRREEA
jgi:ATP-dependent Clp protease ATP-binding subunit ClpC